MKKMNNQEIYYRNLNIPFNIIKFTKNDISTRIETPLNFYQKYIEIIVYICAFEKKIVSLHRKQFNHLTK